MKPTNQKSWIPIEATMDETRKFVTCPWCKVTMPDDPGAYYHEKECHRKDVMRRMDEAAAREVDSFSFEWQRLERELFQASYTGD